MKKFTLSLLAVLMVFVLAAVNVPGTAIAKPVANEPIAEGNWIGGTELAFDFSLTTIPSWLQVLDLNVVNTNKSGEICHPFRGGQFGWVADIRQLVDGKWLKTTTTQGWKPNADGSYFACATVPSAGTYALFGYFDASKAPVQDKDKCKFDTKNWKAYFWYHSKYYPWPEGYSLEIFLADNKGFEEGIPVTYTILGSYPIQGLKELPKSDTTLTWYDGDIYATFTDYVFTGNFDAIPSFSNKIRVEVGDCSVILPLKKITYCDVFGC